MCVCKLCMYITIISFLYNFGFSDDCFLLLFKGILIRLLVSSTLIPTMEATSVVSWLKVTCNIPPVPQVIAQ